MQSVYIGGRFYLFSLSRGIPAIGNTKTSRWGSKSMPGPNAKNECKWVRIPAMVEYRLYGS